MGKSERHVGDRVRFSLDSVFLPGPDETRASLSLESEVEGTIVDFSDSGPTPRAFAVVDVIRQQTVVVPVDKLRRADEPPSGKD